MEGGGSCYNYDTCYGVTKANTKPKQADGYSSGLFLKDTKLRDYLYLRTGLGSPPFDGPPADGSTTPNPFGNMTMIMMPYCTGDAHSGEGTLTELVGPTSTPYYMNFYGHINFKKAIAFLKANNMLNGVKTIWLMGTSAGGAGATKEFSYLRTQFFGSNRGTKQVHLIEDSSPVIPPLAGSPDYLSIWNAYLPGCDSPSATVAYNNAGPTDVLPTPSYVQNTPPPITCTTLQQTRLYNRGLDSSFLYSFLSFKWDIVLNPYGQPNPTDGDYQQFFTNMSQGISEPGPNGNTSLEGVYGTAKSKHLYINNSFDDPATFKPCAKHVVSNFGVQKDFGFNDKYLLEYAHHDFISNMINNPATTWSSGIFNFNSGECPVGAPDN